MEDSHWLVHFISRRTAGFIRLWVAIEPKDKEILAPSISKERDMFVAEQFISGLVHVYGEHQY
jgi:hypothetical protein